MVKQYKEAARWLPFLLIILIAQFAKADVTNDDRINDKLQGLFTMGMIAVNKGLYDESIQIFDYLYNKTKSPRVLLEKARVLYLSGDYYSSRLLFEEIYYDPETPAGVKANIHRYIQSAKKQTFDLEFNLGLTVDDNPLNATYHETVQILGQTLNVSKPVNDYDLLGLWISAVGNLPLGNQLSLFGNARAFDAKGSYFDNQMLKLGLRRSISSPLSGHFDVFYDRKWTNNDNDLLSRGVSLTTYPSNSFDFRLHAELGEQEYLYSPVFNGDYYDVSLSTYRFEKGNYPAEFTLGTSGMNRDDLYNSSIANYAKAKVTTTLSDYTVYTELHIQNSRFRASDPFFLDTRIDYKLQTRIGVELSQLDQFRAKPRLSFVHERNNSTLEYYEYDKVMIELSFTDI